MKDKTPIHPIYLGKVCTGCKEYKILDQYHSHKKGKYGKRSKCKNCYVVGINSWKEENPEKVKGYAKKSRRENIERYRSVYNEWQARNRPFKNAKESIRRASKISATPTWLTKDQKDSMLSMYTLAKKFEGIFKVSYHVDHVIPLRGENVCGLHVPWNLQLLPASSNIRKSNNV